MKTYFIFLCFSLFLTSCVSDTLRVDLSVASTKTTLFKNKKKYTVDKTKKIKEEATISHLAPVFITYPELPSVNQALQKAIDKGGANCVGLSDVKIIYKPVDNVITGMIFGTQKIIVEGYPIHIK